MTPHPQEFLWVFFFLLSPGLGASVLPGLSGSSLGDLLGLLRPIIWQVCECVLYLFHCLS